MEVALSWVESGGVLRVMLEQVDCHEASGKADSDESSERKEETWGESLSLLREHINNHEQEAGRNGDVKGHSSG